MFLFKKKQICHRILSCNCHNIYLQAHRMFLSHESNLRPRISDLYTRALNQRDRNLRAPQKKMTVVCVIDIV